LLDSILSALISAVSLAGRQEIASQAMIPHCVALVNTGLSEWAGLSESPCTLADSLMLVWQHPVDFKTGRQADYPSILGGVE
jgi:hypothetical protein